MNLRNLRWVVATAGLVTSCTVFGETGIGTETGYVLNTFLLLLCGALVMFMAAGFAMLEAGTVQSKSVAVILAKNIALYSVASLMFLMVGYEVMYGVGNSVFGELKVWQARDALEPNLATGQPESASWFFQMVFAATAASVLSGATAERIKIWPFVAFVVVLTGVIYPVVGHWTWGGGWLGELGFSDFAGASIVHSVGGWAALAGIVLLGARCGRFNSFGTPQVLPPSSLPMVTLGTFILWLGWFGFNGGSQLTFASAFDAHAVATIFVNTNAAAAGGVVAAAVFTQLIYRRVNLLFVLNGALAGLVSITAEPLMPTIQMAVCIGAVGSLLMIMCTRLLEKVLLDDVVGAIPVHLAAGIWGTLVVPLSNPDSDLLVQAVGIASIGIFTFGVAFLVFYAMRRTIGIRLRLRQEVKGGDLSEIGIQAYNLG